MTRKINTRQLAAYVAQGMSAPAIADVLGIQCAHPYAAITALCLTRGIALPHNPLARQRGLHVWDLSVQAMRAHGLTWSAIAQILRMTRAQVHQARIRYARAQSAGELADLPHMPVWWARKADCTRRAALLTEDQVRLAHHHLKTAPATARALGISEYVVRRCVKAAKDAR